MSAKIKKCMTPFTNQTACIFYAFTGTHVE